MRNLGLPVLLVFSCRLWSQALSGTIVGTVTDEGGAVVPKAKVVLTNQGTHFVRTEETNASGQYVAYSIPTGAYSIAVEMQGFGRLVRDGVELTAADTVSIDFRLAVGNVQQTVEVQASAPLLQSQTAVVSQLITNQQIEEMPLNGRTFTSLLLLSPGAYTGSSGNLETSQYAIRGSTNYSVNGSSAQNNSYLIDGMVNRNLWLSTLIMVPTIDSIQEFRVMTSNYSAEYGAAAGAVTVVQTKSGTNQLHGSAYEFLRNDKLDANNFFNNRAGVARQPFRRNEFGATAGGPIRTDKTFFFADYQGIRLLLPQTLTSTIPTLAQRAMVTTGDFSGQSAAIFDPASVTGGLRNAFPGKLIPASRLDPAAVKLIGLWPLPQTSATTRNFIFNPAIDQRTDQFDVRLDQNVGNSDRLFFKYSFDDTYYLTPGLLPPAAGAESGVGPYFSANGTSSGTGTPLRNQSGTFNYVKVIGPSTINEVRLGVVRWNQHILPLSNPFNTAAAIGIPGININDKSGGLPSMTVSGYTVIGNGSTYPEQSQTTTFQYQDILTMIRGSHTIKFGAQYMRNRFNGFSAFPTSGSYDFNGQYTRQTGTSGAQTALADFALGVPDAVSRNVLVGTFGMRIWSLSGFADDAWRITNRLTWNFGLRYELYAPPYEVHDHWSNFNVITGKLLLAGSNGNSRRLRNFDFGDFEPRMGLTYALTGDRRTVLRTGFGVSYVEAGKGGGQLYKNLPFYFSQVITTDQNGAPPLRLSDGLPVPTSPNLNNEAEISAGNPNAWDFNMKATQVMQWSFGIQRELLPDLLLDVSYVGSRTNGLNFGYNINQSYPGPGAQGPRRPLFPVNQQVTNVTYETNYGSAKFHSLQGRLQKRYAHGLTVSAAFTYAKYLSNSGHINGGGNGPPQDARCFNCEWGPMPEDRRVVLVVNHSYELPFGIGREFVNHGILAHAVGNWTVTGIWSMLSGDHVTPTLSTAVSNSAGGSADRPNRVLDGNLRSDQRSIDHWFDPLAFVPAAQFTFGNAARGILEGPGK
ncbi:MAG TPA: TonB-dependent receptor, partial [Bryobacteraceae bacterium]|nr:TonB-dependent receptor [Bryobacteraceae bacterium]